MTEDWYAAFAGRLAGAGLLAQQVRELTESAREEAAAAQRPPGELYGPAVLYAGEIAAAYREGSRQPGDDLAADDRPAGDVVLRLVDVHVRRGRRDVLRGVDLEVRTGEVVAVVGANGAGKSTLLDVCAGVLAPDSGTVQRVADFGYAPQIEALGAMLNVDEHFALFGAARGMGVGRSTSTGHHLLRRLGWTPAADQLVGTLSGGTQQKVNVAIAQLHSPRLLLLDEPYQGFDATTYDDLWSLVASWRSSGAVVLVVTHLLRDLDRVDRVVELPLPREERR